MNPKAADRRGRSRVRRPLRHYERLKGWEDKRVGAGRGASSVGSSLKLCVAVVGTREWKGMGLCHVVKIGFRDNHRALGLGLRRRRSSRRGAFGMRVPFTPTFFRSRGDPSVTAPASAHQPRRRLSTSPANSLSIRKQESKTWGSQWDRRDTSSRPPGQQAVKWAQGMVGLARSPHRNTTSTRIHTSDETRVIRSRSPGVETAVPPEKGRQDASAGSVPAGLRERYKAEEDWRDLPVEGQVETWTLLRCMASVYPTRRRRAIRPRRKRVVKAPQQAPCPLCCRKESRQKAGGIWRDK
ncbi:hypothetical protein B0H12DRAFT_1071706 [Mycena haematopus]|nr:hypothetical protein B0H12DRAFT_1071706 [Mycena haematopus]